MSSDILGWADRERPTRSGSSLTAVAALLVALVVAACSGSGGSTGSPATGTPATSPLVTGAPGSQQANVLVDIVECNNAGGTGAASGTIENMADAPAAYRIVLGFFVAGGTKLGEGSDETDIAAPGAGVAWSVAVEALGDAEVTCHTIDVTTIGGSGQPASPAASPATSGAGEYPCRLIPDAVVQQLAGNAVEPGDASTIHNDEVGVTWTARECAWLSFEPGAIEVNLEVTDAAGFPSGSVSCPALPGATGSIDGLGAPASWAWNDPGTTTTVGRIRVCAAAALVDVRVTGPGGEAKLRAVAVGVATKALAAL